MLVKAGYLRGGGRVQGRRTSVVVSEKKIYMLKK